MADLPALAQFEYTMLCVGQAGVDGFPLDPGLQVGWAFLGVGNRNQRLVPQAFEGR